MSVDGVNNSSNAGLYCASGAVLGAGAGAAAGYLTKPFLKDGAPTDSFAKSLGENLIEASDVVSTEQKKFMTEVAPMLEKMSNAKNVDELHNICGEMIDKMTSGKTLEEFKEIMFAGSEVSNAFGFVTNEESLAQIKNAESLDEAKNIIKNSLKQEVETLGFDNVKEGYRQSINTMKDFGIPLTPKDLGKGVWENAYDSANKKFIENGVTEEAMSVIKKTMHSFQGKAALMYGAIGAAVLGVAGYLCGGIGANKETSETPKKVDAQA